MKRTDNKVIIIFHLLRLLYNKTIKLCFYSVFCKIFMLISVLIHFWKNLKNEMKTLKLKQRHVAVLLHLQSTKEVRNILYLTLCTLLTTKPFTKCLNNYTSSQNKLVYFTFRSVFLQPHTHRNSPKKQLVSWSRCIYIWHTNDLCYRMADVTVLVSGVSWKAQSASWILHDGFDETPWGQPDNLFSSPIVLCVDHLSCLCLQLKTSPSGCMQRKERKWARWGTICEQPHVKQMDETAG